MPFRIRIFLSIFLSLLVVLLVGPLLLPAAELQDTEPPESLARPDSRFIAVEGVSLHLLDEGRLQGSGGTPFLLLHGYPGNAESWRAVLPELALYGRALAFDRPGFGLSERPLPGSWRRDQNPYLPDAQVRQAVALLDRLEIDSAVWIGSSSGGVTALQAAIEHPDRVAGLVLVGAPVYAGRAPPAWLRPLLHTPQMNRLGPLLMRSLGGEPGMRLYASQWADPERIGEEEVQAFRRTFAVEDWDRGLWEVSKASRASNLADRLDEVQAEALVVAGTEDAIVEPAESERLAQALPGATLALMEGCGHLPQEECPAAFVEVLAAWLGATATDGRP